MLNLFFFTASYHIYGYLYNNCHTKPKKKHPYAQDTVNRFIKDGDLSSDLASQIRAFFRYRRNATDMSRYIKIISVLSPQMRGHVALELNSSWMKNVQLFSGCDENLLIEVSFVVKPRSYPPLEAFISTEHMVNALYIIRRGLVASKGRIKGAGSAFGEDMVLVNTPYRYRCTTLTFVDLSVLDRSDLQIILDSFPENARMLRRRAKRRSIRERMINFARAVRCMEEYLRRQRAEAEMLNAVQEEEVQNHSSSANNGTNLNLKKSNALPPLDHPPSSSPSPHSSSIPGETVDVVSSDESEIKEHGTTTTTATAFAAVAAAAAAAESRDPRKSDPRKSLDGYKIRRSMVDFESDEDFHLPFGGMINVMMFADERYRDEIETSTIKIQALMRGANTRIKLKQRDEALKADIREQMEAERHTALIAKKVMVEDGLISTEEARPRAAPVGVDGGVAATPGASSPPSMMRVHGGGHGVPPDLARNIRETAAKTDKLEARVNQIVDQQAMILKKISEIHNKVVLMHQSD